MEQIVLERFFFFYINKMNSDLYFPLNFAAFPAMTKKACQSPKY